MSEEQLSYFYEMLEYIPELGRFKWKKKPNPGGKVKAGDLAGHKHNGMGGKPNNTELFYRIISVKNREFPEHNLVWLVETGEFPLSFDIDHRNGQGLDNRFSNLRVANPAQQVMNTACRADNKGGRKGVSWIQDRTGKYRWRVRITSKGKRMHLGWFDDLTVASQVYEDKARELFGEFCYFNRPKEEAC